MKATSWIARTIIRDIFCVEVYITLADFYCKWGILTNWARKQNVQIGGGGRGGNEL